MARAGLSNIDFGGRIRQFVFLIVVTVLGMIVSVVFFGTAGRNGAHAATPQHIAPASAASF